MSRNDKARNDKFIDLLDLGCGVGGTLLYLLARLKARGVGLTLSPVQAEIARRQVIRRGLEQVCLIVTGDFTHPPLANAFDLVYSVEAFIHASAPEAYLSEAARLLRPGGRFVLCDDFKREGAGSAGDELWRRAFQKGWHALNLNTVAHVQAQAAAHGLHPVRARDLTPYLRLRALPDPLARLALAAGTRIPTRHPFWPSLMGSMALQQCYRRGVTEYGWLVFEKGE